MEREPNKRAARILAGLFAGCCFAGAAGSASAAGELNLVCVGNSYAKGGPFPTEETVSLKIAQKQPVLIGFSGSQQSTKAKTVSNNDIQLKFAADGLTGEYFYFSGDLFLIHADGRFTKLLCKPT